ncbi:MAG: regulator of chromosome condensation [Myxococcaceae bacterium]|nr:regulator of chromosome condensation [Myxococcaceae bacterium]
MRGLRKHAWQRVGYGLLVLLGGCGSTVKDSTFQGPGGGTTSSPADASSATTKPAGVADNVAQLACGDFHSCARMNDGTVRCWGRDRDGELGDKGAAGDHPSPMVVAGLSGVEEIALGSSFSCARMKDHTVKCWGSGKIGGDTKDVVKSAPIQVAGITGAVELKAGGYIACVRTEAGAVKCWGDESVKKGAPTTGAVEIAAAGVHACARMADGTAQCWGDGPWAAAAHPSFAKPAITGATSLSTGDAFACAVIAGGSVSCWGRNDQGELGTNPDEDNHAQPVAVRGILGVVKLFSAESHTCALGPDGKAQCWGANEEGELARPVGRTTQELAGPVSGLGLVAEIAPGADHLCARTKSGTASCWGNNKSGQVGDGTTERKATPTRVAF